MSIVFSRIINLRKEYSLERLEIWTYDKEMCLYNIDGYSVMSKCKKEYRAGLVAVFVRWTSLISCLVGRLFTVIALFHNELLILDVYHLHSQSVDILINDIEDVLFKHVSKHFILASDLNFNM